MTGATRSARRKYSPPRRGLNGQVCLNLPLGLGSVCLPVPPWVPGGATVQACLDICTVWGVPCGVEVTVSFNNQRIIQKGFGCC
ncbi:MAG: hypothetical protein ACK40O_10280 [Allosphingosinicella sp.]